MTDRDLIGRGIRRALMRNGMTSAELARRMGVSSSAAGKWVVSSSVPHAGNLRRLCAVLGVSEDEIRAGYPGFAE